MVGTLFDDILKLDPSNVGITDLSQGFEITPDGKLKRGTTSGSDADKNTLEKVFSKTEIDGKPRDKIKSRKQIEFDRRQEEAQKIKDAETSKPEDSTAEGTDGDGLNLNLDFDIPDLPNIDFDVEIPDIPIPEIVVPDVNIPIPEVDIEIPEIPDISFDVEIPDIGKIFDLPETDVPDIKLDIPEISLPKIDLPNIDIPEVDIPKFVDDIGIKLGDMGLDIPIDSDSIIREGDGTGFGEITVGDGIVLDVTNDIENTWNDITTDTVLRDSNAKDLFELANDPKKFVEDKGVEFADDAFKKVTKDIPLIGDIANISEIISNPDKAGRAIATESTHAVLNTIPVIGNVISVIARIFRYSCYLATTAHMHGLITDKECLSFARYKIRHENEFSRASYLTTFCLLNPLMVRSKTFTKIIFNIFTKHWLNYIKAKNDNKMTMIIRLKLLPLRITIYAGFFILLPIGVYWLTRGLLGKITDFADYQKTFRRLSYGRS